MARQKGCIMWILIVCLSVSFFRREIFPRISEFFGFDRFRLNQDDLIRLKYGVFCLEKDLHAVSYRNPPENYPPNMREIWQNREIGGNYKIKRHREKKLVDFLHKIDRILTENCIEYVLGVDSLLGSYVAHGPLPWHDYVTLQINSRDVMKFYRLKLSKVFETFDVEMLVLNHTYKFPYGSEFFNETIIPNADIKLHSLNEPNMEFSYFNPTIKYTYKWSWPYINVSLFDANNTDVIVCPDSRLSLPRSEFYPLHRRPFAGLWLPSPRNPMTVLRKVIQNRCVKGPEIYRVDVDRNFEETTVCPLLAPFAVNRVKVRGGVKETLQQLGQDLYSVRIHESFETLVHPYYLCI